MSPNLKLVVWGALAVMFGVSSSIISTVFLSTNTETHFFWGMRRFRRMRYIFPQMHYHWLHRKIKSKLN